MYANEPYLAYIYGNEAADYRRLPLSRPGGKIIGSESATGEEQLGRWVEQAPGGAYLVWFSEWEGNRLFDYGPAEFRASPGLELVAELDDGVVFRVNRDYDGGD